MFPHELWAYGLLSYVNAAIGLGGAWMLIGDFADGRKRATASVLLLLTPLYTFYAYKYNANIIFLSIWPLTLHYFMQAIDKREWKDSIRFGVCVGLALMSKYYALILVASCFVAALQHPLGKRYLASASPYVSMLVAAAICAPHVWWLLTNRAPPLAYLASRSGLGWGTLLSFATGTLLGGLEMNIAMILVVAVVARTSPREWIASLARKWADPRFRVLVILALGPLVLTFASAFLLRTRIYPEMLLAAFPLMPLLTIEIAGVKNIDVLWRVASRLAAGLTLGAVVLSPVIAVAREYLSANAMDVAPHKEIAIEATRLWHDRTGLPLAYVGGTNWYEQTISFYSPDHPHAFINFDFTRSLWVTPEALAEHGLLAICVKDDSDCLASTARFATPLSTQTEVSMAHAAWGHTGKTYHFILTIIPPRT